MSQPRQPSPLANRVKLAIAESNLSATGLETLIFGKDNRGYISRLLRGVSGGTRTEPWILERLSELLHVRMEWLATGRPPMRESDDARSPKDEAIRIARRWGASPEAIADALAMCKGRLDDRDERGWVTAIMLMHERQRKGGTR